MLVIQLWLTQKNIFFIWFQGKNSKVCQKALFYISSLFDNHKINYTLFVVSVG